MAVPRGARAGKTVRGEPHVDPPQMRGGSGKGTEGRSPPAGSEGSEREHLSPWSFPLHEGGEILRPGARVR